MYDFSRISVYFDSNGKLIGVPFGKDPKIENGVIQLNTFFVLESGYTDDELEAFISKVFDACYSEIGTHDGPTAIQLYTKAKSYVSAVKGYQLVSVKWLKDKGYTVCPWQVDKKHKGAFMEIKGISIGIKLYSKHRPIEKGAVALAFKTAMEIVKQSDV